MEYNKSNKMMGNRSSFQNNNQDEKGAEAANLLAAYQSEWLLNEANPKMIDFSEKAGKFMANNGLTNSQIRNVFGEIKRIQMAGYEKDKASFLLLKPKMAYAASRNKNDGLNLFKDIFNRSFLDITSEKSYLNFCKFIESILAYHKAYGGKD